MKFRAKIHKEGAPDETRTIEAPSRFAVYELVQKEGATVIELTDGGGFTMPKWLNMTIGSGVKRADTVHFAKNLSGMITAGLSLSRALSVIGRQSGAKRFKVVVADIAEAVKKGSSFNEALAAHPKIFSELFIAMARAGEESGSLADSLGVVAVQMERSEELIKKVRGAMIYPAVVISAVVVVGILMMVYVVPTLASTFEQLGAAIPLSTRIILGISNFMVNDFAFFMIGLVAIIVGGIMFIRSKRGKALILIGALHTPVIGELVRETYTARAARTLSSLLAAGVPVLEALAITKAVVHASAFANVISEAEEGVKKGEPLSSAFAGHPKLYPLLMADMLEVGEETGTIAAMLKQIAEYYEGDVAEKTKDLSAIVEPMLILIIGVAVGIFAISIIAPIYSLSNVIGN